MLGGTGMNDYIVGSSNFTLIAILLFVSGVVAIYARQRWKQDDINKITLLVLVGASIESFSWALNRTYWLAWRYYKLVNGEEAAHFFWDISWLTYISTLGIYIGAALMMAPITILNFGKYWIAVSVCIILVLQLIGFLIIAVLKT
jgi:hypothetical protein